MFPSEHEAHYTTRQNPLGGITPIRQGTSDAQHHEMTALRFIQFRGSDQVGVIDDRCQLAAALLYDRLRQEGYLLAEIADDGCGHIYKLSNKGKFAASQSVQAN